MGRVRSTFFVVVVAGTVVAVAGVTVYRVGQLAEPLMRFLDPRLAPTIDEAFVSLPVEYALRSDEANDVVFLGDSTCHDEVDPARMSGVKAYNCGSLGSIGPLGILLTAEAYVDRHPAPRLVVLVVSPLRFEVNSGSAGGHVVRRLVANYGVEVADVVPLSESVPYFVRRGSLELSGRREGIPFFDKPLRGMEKEIFHTLERRMHASRGFFALPGEHGGRWAVEMPAPRTFILDEWKDGLKRLAAVCHKSGAKLLVRFGPIWDGVRHLRDFSKLDAWADDFESSCPSACVARPTIVAWDRSLKWDSMHLNSAGVDRFMPTVGNEVRAVLGNESAIHR
jgi:hypothetical protein